MPVNYNRKMRPTKIPRKGEFLFKLSAIISSPVAKFLARRIFLAETIPAKNLASGSRLKRHLRVCSARGAFDVIHLPILESAALLILKNHLYKLQMTNYKLQTVIRNS